MAGLAVLRGFAERDLPCHRSDVFADASAGDPRARPDRADRRCRGPAVARDLPRRDAGRGGRVRRRPGRSPSRSRDSSRSGRTVTSTGVAIGPGSSCSPGGGRRDRSSRSASPGRSAPPSPSSSGWPRTVPHRRPRLRDRPSGAPCVRLSHGRAVFVYLLLAFYPTRREQPPPPDTGPGTPTTPETDPAVIVGLGGLGVLVAIIVILILLSPLDAPDRPGRDRSDPRSGPSTAAMSPIASEPGRGGAGGRPLTTRSRPTSRLIDDLDRRADRSAATRARRRPSMPGDFATTAGRPGPGSPGRRLRPGPVRWGHLAEREDRQAVARWRRFDRGSGRPDTRKPPGEDRGLRRGGVVLPL